MSDSNQSSAVAPTMGGFAPQFVEATDDVLFGDTWSAELAQRDAVSSSWRRWSGVMKRREVR
jgi:hypothetical protein